MVERVFDDRAPKRNGEDGVAEGSELDGLNPCVCDPNVVKQLTVLCTEDLHMAIVACRCQELAVRAYGNVSDGPLVWCLDAQGFREVER